MPEVDPCDSLSDNLSGDCSNPTDPEPITPTVPPVTTPDPTDPVPITPTVPPVEPSTPTDPEPITPTVPPVITPDPTDPVPITPTVPSVTPPVTTAPPPVEPVPPIYIETAEGVDQQSKLHFTNLNRERAINIIQTIFLPRNVDAQSRTFSNYGVSLMHAVTNAECPKGTARYDSWTSLLYSRDGEGDDEDLVWNAFESESVGVAAGVCIPHGEKNKWGLMAHYGQSEIDHDIPGTYESDNYGTGIFYIRQNDSSRISASLIYANHDGENIRQFNKLRSIGLGVNGNQDSSSLHLGLTIEKTKSEIPEQGVKPFGALLLSYIDQEAYNEVGFSLFTLQYDSRQTWWLNAEAGIKYIKNLSSDKKSPWRIESAVALNVLDNIGDEDQRFTYYWNQSLAIPSKGETEVGGALSLGLFRDSQEPDAWRTSASVNIGYISEQITNSVMLTLIVPFGN